jgi:hypothetical protein
MLDNNYLNKLTEIADVSGAFNIPAESAQEVARPNVTGTTSGLLTPRI